MGAGGVHKWVRWAPAVPRGRQARGVYDEGPHEPIAWPRRADGRSDRNLRTALRNGTLVRPVRGAYVDPERIRVPPAFYPYADAGAALAAARAALAVLPAAALADETAAYLLCGLWPPDSRPRLVVPAPATCTRRPETVLREAALPEGDVLVIDGLRTTSGTRTALDLARRAPGRGRALAAVDALLRAGQTTPSDLAVGLERWAGHRGVLRARALLALADGRSESPGESRIRLALLDAGVGPVELQVPVCGGRYRVDLVVAGRVLVEFEGTHHDAPDAQLADRMRFNALAALPGVRVLRYTSRDLARLDAVVAEVRAALVRRP